ncbi:MAG: hypothetical protein AAFV47_11425 [Pseudomonadota bacterium]
MSFLAELKRRNVIRVATVYAVGTWLVLQVGDITSGLLGLPDWTLRFILFVAALGFPFALIFSWVYELTPEGIKRESEIDRSQSITTETGSRLNTVIIGLLTLAVAVLLADRIVTRSSAPDPTSVQVEVIDDHSIAVLPFDDYSAEGERYLANGLTETLTTMLTSVQNLRVTGQTSAFAFVGANKPAPEIASELGVVYLLRGSVQRSGENLRITANLIDSKKDATVWSEVFDKSADDIFQIQDEIADTVVAIIAADIVSGGSGVVLESVGTTNRGAYELFLRAVEARRPGSFEALQSAEILLKNALTLDPDFFEALVELTDLYSAQINTGLRPRSEYGDVLAISERALSIRPDSIDAQVMNIQTKVAIAFGEGDFGALDNLEEQTKKILERENLPVRAMGSLAGYLQWAGRDEEAIGLLEQAAALDPLNPEYHFKIGFMMELAERFSEARTAYRRSLEVEQSQPLVWASLAFVDARMGDLVGFIKNYDRSMEFDRDDPELPGAVAYELYKIDLVDEAEPYLERVEEMAPGSDIHRLLQLERAAAVGDMGLLSKLSRQAIIDDAPSRGGFFASAVRYLIESAVALDQLDDALAFLDETVPDFRSPYRSGVPSKVSHARILSEPFLIPTYSADERERYAGEVRLYLENSGADLSLSRHLNIILLALEDDEDQLTRFYRDNVLDAFTFRGPRQIERQLFSLDLGKSLLEDNEIRRKLTGWDTALDRTRANVKRHLATPQNQRSTEAI